MTNKAGENPPPYLEAVESNTLAGNVNPGYGPTPGDQAGVQAYGYSQQQHYGFQSGGYSTAQASQLNAVVVTQPGSQSVMVNSVPDHMGLALFATICCCWPLGLVAIMRAQESRRAVDRGDLISAVALSNEARRYSMWAMIGGGVTIIFIVVIVVVVVTQDTYYY